MLGAADHCPATARGTSRSSALGRALVGPLVLVLAVGTGCSGDASGDGDGASGSGPKVIQPGGPGEAASTLEPGEEPQVDEIEWNHTDVAFMQMMIPHHAQALAMAKLAEKRSQDRQVRQLAERIRAAQGPEIAVMATWLDERNLEVPRAGDDPHAFDHSRHGHNAMLGMLSEKSMRQLSAAHGSRFDRLFLEGMIRHHQGAIEMAGDAAEKGTGDIRVEELTADVSAGQTAEIGRMRDLLDQIGA